MTQEPKPKSKSEMRRLDIMKQEPKPREWWMLKEPNGEPWGSHVHVIEYSAYLAMVKAHDEMVRLNKDLQNLYKQSLSEFEKLKTEAEKDYSGMREFQRKFIEADQRAEGLVGALGTLTSAVNRYAESGLIENYTSVMGKDLSDCVDDAREALKKWEDGK